MLDRSRKRFERWCLARTSNPVRPVATRFWRVRFPSASAENPVDAGGLRPAQCAAGGGVLYSRAEAARILIENRISDGEIEALIAERQNARKSRNFKRSDEIRDQLVAAGIVLEDTKEGARWKRK